MVDIVKIAFKLRPFVMADVENLVLGLNKKTIARDTTIDLPWDENKASWWISFINDAAEQSPISEKHFAIEADGKLVGSIGIINIEGHKCEIGYWLSDDYAGRGIMSQAIGEAVQYGAKNLRIKRFFAPVLTHNKASVRVLEKNGFEYEGCLRKFYLKDGKYIDALGYALVC